MIWSRLDVAARRRLVYWVLEGCLEVAREQLNREKCTDRTVDAMCAAALREAFECADVGAFDDVGIHYRYQLHGLACRGEITHQPWESEPRIRVTWDICNCATLRAVLEVPGPVITSVTI